MLPFLSQLSGMSVLAAGFVQFFLYRCHVSYRLIVLSVSLIGKDRAAISHRLESLLLNVHFNFPKPNKVCHF